MKILLIRHAQSEENSKKILAGRIPGNLTNIGFSQANTLAQYLSRLHFDYILTSPINRALSTANIIHEFHNSSPLIINDLLIEREFGKLSGKTRDEVDFEKLDNDEKYQVEMGVESLDDLSKRIDLFLEKIKKDYSDKTIVIVTHSNPLRVFLMEILNISFNEALNKYSLSNCSISEFDYDDEWHPIRISDDSFLN